MAKKIDPTEASIFVLVHGIRIILLVGVPVLAAWIVGAFIDATFHASFDLGYADAPITPSIQSTIYNHAFLLPATGTIISMVIAGTIGAFILAGLVHAGVLGN